MNIEYGSAGYFLPMLIIFVFTAVMYFALRGRSARVQKLAVFILAAVNVLQHLLKQFIYPHYWGDAYPDMINTAYNMCAALILLTPFVLFLRGTVFKQFIAYVGTAAGLLTMFVPYWYIGQTLFQWDVLRYYLCHGLLFAASLLPALWGLYKFSWRDFWKMPFVFFFVLILIIFNYFVFWCLGVGVDNTSESFFQTISNANPLWVMHPDEQFAFIIPVIDFFTPNIFFPQGEGGMYTPVLWYAIPITLLMWVLGFALGALIDRKNFVSDMRAFAAIFRRRAVARVCPAAGTRVKYKRPQSALKRVKWR